jgi:hypothetical protein
MEAPERLSYHLCIECQRAVSAASGEVYCPNDGTKMLTGCPHCGAGITSPYSRFCAACGARLFGEVTTKHQG